MPQSALAMTGLSRLLLVSACIVSAPLGAARAQLIPVKTARIAEADLSSYFPAANAGMGTLLTIPDTVLDPFNNPASGRRVRRAHVVGSLSSYSVSHNLGTGSTTPIGVFGPLGKWFGGFSVARQGVSPPDATGFSSLECTDRNRYGFALLGLGLGATSVGVSAAWSALGALDGADLLYPGMSSLQRSSNARDVRLGAITRFGRGTSVEAVFLQARTSSNHDVTFEDRLWNPNNSSLAISTRVERDRDRVETTGLHLVMSHPLADTTWRLGAGLTANRIEHTLMPVLGATSLKRDPGRSNAFNAIVGFSHAGAKLRYGMDAIYEPIWSEVSLTGAPNDDRYRFNNAVVRGGISADYHPMGLQSSVRLLFGAQMRAIRYALEQTDIAAVVSTTNTAWNEWTHNWGVSFIDKALTLHLQWRLQSGARRPGFGNTSNFDFFATSVVPNEPGFGLHATRVSTLQITAAVPLP